MIIQLFKDCVNDIFSRLFRLKPIRLMLFVTHRCNARCIMCNVWKNKKEKELSLKDYDLITSDEIFNKIRSITITGGEACLRNDLVEIISILIKNIRKINKIILTTNGSDTNLVASQIKNIAEILNKRSIQLSVQISFDSTDLINDKIRGVNSASSKVMSTVSQVEKIQKIYPFIEISFNCVIQPLNVMKLESILDYFWSTKHNFTYSVVTYSNSFFDNISNENIRFDAAQKRAAIAVFATSMFKR